MVALRPGRQASIEVGAWCICVYEQVREYCCMFSAYYSIFSIFWAHILIATWFTVPLVVDRLKLSFIRMYLDHIEDRWT